MLSQAHISASPPAGSVILQDGACFKVWAPRATAVYLNGIFGGVAYDTQGDDRLLAKDGSGYWTGFQPGAADGDLYRYWVDGEGSSGYKRDPRARELDPSGFPACFAILRAADSYPWHDSGFRTPDFSDMVVYQLHIGTYAIGRPGTASNFLDIVGKIPYLAALGIMCSSHCRSMSRRRIPPWGMAAPICIRRISLMLRSLPICPDIFAR